MLLKITQWKNFSKSQFYRIQLIFKNQFCFLICIVIICGVLEVTPVSQDAGRPYYIAVFNLFTKNSIISIVSERLRTSGVELLLKKKEL